MTQADHTLRHLTGYALRRATSAAMPGVNKVLETYGLRRSSYSSLAVIVANPGLNQGQLADALSIERPNVVQIIDRLERMKLVQRTKSMEDRRAYALQPTAKGCSVQDEATRALQQFDSRLRDGLTDGDLATLHRSLTIIEQNAVEMELEDDSDISTS